MPDVTVVVVSYNTRDLLDQCIGSIYEHSLGLDKEVIVVDNVSVDGSRELLAEKYPQVKVIVNEDNRGYAPACNQGLSAASSEYAMALNSDAFFVGDALVELVEHMRRNPGLCAVVPRVLNEDRSLQPECARNAPSVWDQFLFYSKLNGKSPKLAWRALSFLPKDQYDVIRDVQVLGGAAVLFRKSCLEKAGMLDERLKVNYDDIEWSLRAGRAGCRLGYFPEAEVVHLRGQSRKVDPYASALRNYDTTFTFFDIAFSLPSATFLKATVLGELALDVVQSLVRPKEWRMVRTRVKILSTVTRMAFRRRTRRLAQPRISTPI